jgi:hypothetical protein
MPMCGSYVESYNKYECCFFLCYYLVGPYHKVMKSSLMQRQVRFIWLSVYPSAYCCSYCNLIQDISIIPSRRGEKLSAKRRFTRYLTT